MDRCGDDHMGRIRSSLDHGEVLTCATGDEDGLHPERGQHLLMTQADRTRTHDDGTPTPIQQLANFSVPEPRILVVNPFDKAAIDDISRAIGEATLDSTRRRTGWYCAACSPS